MLSGTRPGGIFCRVVGSKAPFLPEAGTRHFIQVIDITDFYELARRLHITLASRRFGRTASDVSDRPASGGFACRR
jgi:hypothetical protein